MSHHYSHYKRGVSLVEMLIYLAVLVVLVLALINTLYSFTSSYRQLSVLRSIDQSALTGIEQMTRDIRAATSVDTTDSTFGASHGTLVLFQTLNGVSTTTKFYLVNGRLNVDVNNTNLGPLTLSSAYVSSLTFTLATSSNSEAIKIDMTITATSTSVSRTKNFHSTVILK